MLSTFYLVRANRCCVPRSIKAVPSLVAPCVRIVGHCRVLHFDFFLHAMMVVCFYFFRFHLWLLAPRLINSFSVFLSRLGYLQLCGNNPRMFWSPRFPGPRHIVFSYPPLECLVVVIVNLHHPSLSLSGVFLPCLCHCWTIHP